MRQFFLLTAAALSFAACTAQSPSSSGTTPPPEDTVADTQAMAENADQLATRILDQQAAERLRGAQGITLQWISWNWRGQVEVLQPGDVIMIKGGQDSAKAPANAGDLGTGRVEIDGVVTEIGADYFLFDGEIVITDSPDIGRICRWSGPVEFRITQGRQYWRMQDMTKCDGLTDYVDIYF